LTTNVSCIASDYTNEAECLPGGHPITTTKREIRFCIALMHERRVIDADLCVVGAGIVGLAHALEARRRGLRVALLDRDRRAVGASVRNFGHAFISGVASGADLDCALRSRERWVELGARAGISVREAGTLVVARETDELAVLEGAASDPRRRARMVTARQAGELAPIPTDQLLGAMHGTLDLRVDPREAVAGLATLLDDDEGAQLIWGTCVHAVEPGQVLAGQTVVRAPLILMCPGPDLAGLPAGARAGLGELTLSKLQMLRVASPGNRRYPPALLTGLSLIRYPAFTAQDGADAVRERLVAQRPDLVEAGIHLIVAQLPDGDLILGDSHEYGDTPTPFGSEQIHELLLAEARRLLGVDALEVRERWIGVYPTAAGGHLATAGDHLAVSAPFPGARVVEVISGLGMTMALGAAGGVLDDLERATSILR
jgi:FAD dependent oxidoreductase TIGR03364